MKILQKLISDKLEDGKSLRQIAKESGVEYTSVNNYLNNNVEPRGKNLALLSKYFNVPFADLMDDYVPTDDQSSPLRRRVIDAVKDATDEELQAMLVLLRKRDKQG